ncbi:cadherin domain-containing protein [Bradyrhizobium sp. GCM10027634]|uniref:cadherin domain-containing protein n=1 Tax=unclassified Bradyrhizobium TaxID=2631580 RepID=UPI00188CCBEA|nr:MULTISPECIES: cadherin domain-containing protein [unclassified Bradyrhizobium]MDN5000401.1 cadherin domain-containing protein [Bradyrhizobium sp. WYCCWR 12677]
MTTIPAYTSGGLTRPPLILDSYGNIVLDDAASTFAATYGLKALYLGCPPGTPWPPVHDSISTPIDANAGANSVAEGAVANTPVGITASATSAIGPVTYSLVGDNSGGGFKINAATGVVTVNDPTKIDFESAPGHAYTISVKASDGFLTSTQSFTIHVTDVAPSTPVDSNAAANHVAEGAAINTLVGITASSTDINGGAVTFAITGDTSGGGFKVDPHTGVVSVADGTKIDYESAPGHAYSVTIQASDGTLTSSQTFTIGVDDVTIGAPTDTNAAANHVSEGAAAGTAVGITASAIDPNGPATTYSLIGDTSGGGFTINSATGVVTVADPTKIDFETSGAGHSYGVTVQAVNGATTTSSSFTIAVDDVAPTPPSDNDPAANTVTEGAANGSTVGVTAISTDVNGPAVTYSLTGDTSGGGFTINAATGVVTVADSTKIDFESAPSHAYSITVQSSDGTLTNSETISIAVTDVAPSVPIDNDATANSVAEGAAAGSTVGITVASSDVNGSGVTGLAYSLTSDTSGGGFTINGVTGVITVADPTKIDFESSGAGHSYTVTAQASDGTLTSSQTFTINVSDVPPTTPVDADAATNTIAEGAANGSTVGVTASATDVNGPAVTYSLTGDTSGGGFTINATTGVVTVADSTKIDFETSGAGHSYTVTATASDGTDISSQSFTIAVTDVAPTTPVDSDGAVNQVSMNAPVGTYTGVTASSIDVNGPAVTYSLVGDTSGGGFTVDASTGQVKVADSTKIPYNAGSPTFDVTVQASDGTLTSQQTFTINVLQNTPPVANDDSLSATEAGGANNSVAGFNPSGNVILGTGSAGALQDTDAEDPSTALTVVAVHTGSEGASTGTGTVGQDLIGSHGTLHLNGDGSYTYTVNQNDAQVQALHTSANTIQDKFNYTIQDTGGLQDNATITFTIHGADDLPVAVADTGTMTEDDAPTSFNVIANDSQDPDSTASNVITLGPAGITVTGPAGETFANTDATASIVANQVQVTLNNAHFQQLAVGEHATITVPYTLTGDTGETSSANLVVTVDGVNDVPVAVDDSGTMTEDQSGHAFTVLTNDTLDPDHGAPNNITTGTVTNVVGPAGENIDVTDIAVSVNGSNQIVVNLGSDFQHLKDGEAATFDVPYTLHGDQAGDTSTATLHVTVNGVNDAPVASNFTFNGVNSATGNTDLVVNDPTDGAPSTTGPNKTITASLLSGASDVDGPGPLIVVAGNIATAHGGSVTMQSDGDFIYKPPVGYTGSDSFTYQVSDQNAGASGVGLGTGTITINVTTPKVWYVNADAATDGDGSSENPFNNLSHFNGAGGVDGTGDTIFLETSSSHYTAPAGGLQLENNEQLISQSAGLVVPDGGGGAGTVTLVSASGANAVIDGGVILASGNNIQGVDFGSSSTFSLSGTNVGTSTIDNVKSGVINNTGSGGAISITGSGNALTYDFSSLTSSGGSNGIVINGASGTFHAHGGAISGASGSDVSLSSGTLNFTDDGTISDNTGSTLSISSMTGGTQSFTGTISSSGTGISLTNNTGATMSFSGGIGLSTGTSNAFTATGGGTLNVTGTNHLTTTTGTALNITNTTIGSSNVTFHDISSDGAVNGIVLNNTGTSGHLAVTGVGTTAGSGGTIQNSTGDGVSLTSTQDVSLSNMNIKNGQGDGILGNTINGLALNGDTVSGNGNSTANDGEGNIYLYELTGNASHATTFNNLTVSNSYVHNVFIKNTGGTLTDLVVTNSTFSNNGGSTHAGDQFQIDLATGGIAGSPTATVHATNNTFSGNILTPANFTATGFAGSVDDGTLNVHLGDGTAGGKNTFDSNDSGITLTQTGSASLNFDVNDNTLTNSRAVGIAANHFGTGTVTGFLNNNTVGIQGVQDSGVQIGSGFDIHDEAASGTMTVSITNNIIQSLGGDGNGADGIAITNAVGTQDSASILNATVTGNTIRDILDYRGLTVLDSNTAGNSAINLLLSGNSFTNADGTGTITTARVGGAPAGTDPVNVTQANAATLASDNGLTASNSIGSTMRVDTNVSFNHAAPPTPPATPQMALHGQGHDGGTDLTMNALAPVLVAAIQHWADAGASAAQIAQLENTKLSIADLPDSGYLANTGAKGITIDVNAAGWGWYVDPTPSDNSEYHSTAAPNDLVATSGDAASHIDLLTVLEHELGHVLGLPDTSLDGVMNLNLDTGERRLVTPADVAQATPLQPTTSQNSNSFVSDNGGHNFVFSEPHIPAPTTSTPVSSAPAWSAGLAALQAALHNADSFSFAWFAANHFQPSVAPTLPGPGGTPIGDTHQGGDLFVFSNPASGSPALQHADVIVSPETHPVSALNLPDFFHLAPFHFGLLT